MVCMFPLKLCTKLHIPILNFLLVVTMKLKGNKNFHTANKLLFYIPLKYYLKKVPYFSKICYHTHFRDLKQVAVVLLLLHLVGIRRPYALQWKIVNCFKSSFMRGTDQWTNRCMGRLAEGQTHTPACTCSMVISQGFVFPLQEEKVARIHSLCNILNPHKPACSQSYFWLNSCTLTVPLTIPCQYHKLKNPSILGSSWKLNLSASEELNRELKFSITMVNIYCSQAQHL